MAAKGKGKWDSHVLPRLEEVKAWAAEGLNERQIASKLDIAYSTLRQYKDSRKELSDALQGGKEAPDIQVENAFLKRVIGYDAKESTEIWRPNEDGEMILAERRVSFRHIPGDVRGQMFWLANRNRSRWQYRPEGAEDMEEAAYGVVLLPQVNALPEPEGGEGE